MNDPTILLISIVAFVAAIMCLPLVLRQRRVSLGLPFAYSFLLMIEHVPGAWGTLNSDSQSDLAPVAIGMSITAVGLWAFVGGTALAQINLKRFRDRGSAKNHSATVRNLRIPMPFLFFCIFGGWLFFFVLRTAINLPSINAVVEKGSGIWLLGVMVGLGHAVMTRRFLSILLWGLAMLVYPLYILVVGGFASWGASAIVISLSLLVVILKRFSYVLIGVLTISVLGMAVFVSYFDVRSELRSAAWTGAPIEERAEIASKIFSNFMFVDSDNSAHLEALNNRLNQNYFIGIAAQRLDDGQVEYLRGRSLVDGALSLIPRAIWTDKPLYGGSGTLVRDMTGLPLSETTAWGVGSVMEFYINFGILGVSIGMLVFGWLIARLDRRAAEQLIAARYGESLLFFLPCAALAFPLASIVELTSGAAAAWLAALGWRFIWTEFARRRAGRRSYLGRDAPSGRLDATVFRQDPILRGHVKPMPQDEAAGIR